MSAPDILALCLLGPPIVLSFIGINVWLLKMIIDELAGIKK